MAKAVKEAMYLVSSEGTGFFYTYRRNRKKMKGEKKLALMKFDPIAGKRVKFEEKKDPPKLKKRYKKETARAAK